MLSKFFIQRPIFCQCTPIIVMAFGIFSVLNLPVERYPDIALLKLQSRQVIVVRMHKRLSKVLLRF